MDYTREVDRSNLVAFFVFSVPNIQRHRHRNRSKSDSEQQEQDQEEQEVESNIKRWH